MAFARPPARLAVSAPPSKDPTSVKTLKIAGVRVFVAGSLSAMLAFEGVAKHA